MEDDGATREASIANAKALRDLEFARLKGIVRQHASASLGEEAIDALVPIAERATIERRIEEVEEAIRFLHRAAGFSLGGVRDLVPIVHRARETAFLDGEDFLVVLQTIDSTQQICEQLTDADDMPRISTYASRLSSGRGDLGKRIRRTIDERGGLRDDASPSLMAMTKKRRVSESRVEAKLRSLIERSPELINEPVITRRRGRLVVPIRSGATGAMDFVVHDRSSTGQTLYAEPTALVAENNAIAELAEQIREETRRILRELTEALIASAPALLRDRAILAHLDSLFARASYAQACGCSFPTLGKTVALRNAFHPLLPRETAVPITLSLGAGPRMAIITGPNTGGKTVTLKTLGLLTLMTQAGIPIPASPDSELALVSRVRTDIGDEQSIEQNLSTFSGHMKNIVSVLAEADAESLILLDELGAGTDPQEGAALGLAMIESLLESDCLTVVSTHLTPLKYFAVRHPEIKTASMEFDLATLSPTYRVIEGLPGRSNAFIIAQSLGLSEDRIERARAFLSQGEVRAEDIIEELHRERQAVIRQREEVERDRIDARRAKEEYERKLLGYEQEREEALSGRLKAFDAFLRDGQRRVEEILAEMHAGASSETGKDNLRTISDLRDAVRSEREEASKRMLGEPMASGSLEPGTLVHVRSLDADGRIVHVDAKGKATIDLDGIRVTTERSDLSPPSGSRRGKEPAGQRHRPRPQRPRLGRVSLQMDVRGMSVNDALREVEGYLDQLLLADIRHASILHGKGTGALSDAIRAYLGSCSFIESFGFAPPNRGGEGVTDFELTGGADSE